MNLETPPFPRVCGTCGVPHMRGECTGVEDHPADPAGVIEGKLLGDEGSHGCSIDVHAPVTGRGKNATLILYLLMKSNIHMRLAGAGTVPKRENYHIAVQFLKILLKCGPKALR